MQRRLKSDKNVSLCIVCNVLSSLDAQNGVEVSYYDNHDAPGRA